MVRAFNTAFSELLADDSKRPIYGVSVLGVLTAEVVSFSMSTGIVVDDVSNFPESGGLKINDELFTYQSINTGANRFEGIQREIFATVDAGDPVATDTVTVAYLLSSGDISSHVNDPAVHPVLESYSGSSQRLNSLEGQSSTGSISFKFLDYEEFFTVAMGVNQGAFREKEVRAIVGFDDLQEYEYEVEFVGYVQSLKMDANLTSWVVVAGDAQRLLHAPMSLGKTKLRTAITGNPANADVDSVTNFNTNGGYFRVEDEIIAYTSVTGGASPTLNGLTRAQFGTVSANHAIDEPVSEIFEIEDNPVDILLKIMTSTGNGTNGTYDVLSAEKGMAIDQSLIDIATFESERDDFFSSTTYRFRLKETIGDLKSFFEKEILRPLNANFKADATGVIGFVYNRPVLTLDEQIQVDEDSIDGKPRWSQNMNSIVNQITINRDQDVFDSEFKAIDIFVDATSVSLHGLAKEYTLDLLGIHADLDGDNLVSGIETQIRRRFGNPPPVVSVTCKMEKLDIEVGDIVFLSHPLLPNPDSQDRGLREVQYQVVQRRADYLRGRLTLELLDTRRTGRFGGIAPNTSVDNPPSAFPDYAAAGSLDRQYMFISDNSGKMSNGDDGYLIV